MGLFVPEIKKKYIPSIDFSEDKEGQIHWFGFYSDDVNYKVDGYFDFKIDPQTDNSSLVKLAPFPDVIRAEFMSEKKAARGEPLNFMALYDVDWKADRGPIIFGEFQNRSSLPLKSLDIVFLRADSAMNLHSAGSVNKNQFFTGERQTDFIGFAKIAINKEETILCYNQDFGPLAKMRLGILDEAKYEEWDMAKAEETGVIALPRTYFAAGSIIYFVGESEYRESYRIGVLERK